MKRHIAPPGFGLVPPVAPGEPRCRFGRDQCQSTVWDPGESLWGGPLLSALKPMLHEEATLLVGEPDRIAGEGDCQTCKGVRRLKRWPKGTAPRRHRRRSIPGDPAISAFCDAQLVFYARGSSWGTVVPDKNEALVTHCKCRAALANAPARAVHGGKKAPAFPQGVAPDEGPSHRRPVGDEDSASVRRGRHLLATILRKWKRHRRPGFPTVGAGPTRNA